MRFLSIGLLITGVCLSACASSERGTCYPGESVALETVFATSETQPTSGDIAIRDDIEKAVNQKLQDAGCTVVTISQAATTKLQLIVNPFYMTVGIVPVYIIPLPVPVPVTSVVATLTAPDGSSLKRLEVKGPGFAQSARVSTIANLIADGIFDAIPQKR